MLDLQIFKYTELTQMDIKVSYSLLFMAKVRANVLMSGPTSSVLLAPPNISHIMVIYQYHKKPLQYVKALLG